jgi:probable rRNA maturation factor
MDLSFENRQGEEYDRYEKDYLSILEKAFSLLGVKDNYEVDVSLVDEATIQDINRDYRHIDKVTDVISFAFNDDKSAEGQIIDSSVPKMLGEIFICVPRALSQAKEIGNSEHRELCFLFCHGLLHLLGYDHMEEKEAKEMFALQEKILDEVKKEAKK